MLFLELAAQAVKGFSPSVRVSLKPGYSALTSPVEAPAPLSGLVVALAFPDGRGGDGAFLAPGAKSGRAGLSIQGNDGSVWRIMRDLGGAGGLHRLNRSTNQFEIITQEATEMAQTLRASVGFPARTTWEQLFTLSATQLPTRRPRGPAKAASTEAKKPRIMSKWDSFDTDGGGGEGADIDAARLPELEQELSVARRAAEVQFRADGISSEIFELESKVKAADEVAAEVLTVRGEAARFDNPALTDDFIARVRKLPDDKRRLDEQLARLEDEQRAWVESAPPAPEPLQKDPRFLASLVVGVGLFVAALVMDGAARYLALLSLVPFTFAALFALRFIEDLQRLSRGGGKGEVLAGREKKLRDDYAAQLASLQRVFELVGASNPDEFLTAMESRDVLQGRLGELEQKELAVRAALESTGIKGRYDTLKAEQEKLNAELVGMSGGYVRDVRDIERDIARAKGGGAQRPSPVPASPPPEAEAAPVGGADQWEDPTPALLSLATDVFSSDIPTLWTVLQGRAVQYLSALTDRRYHGLAVDRDGQLSVEAPGRTLRAAELPGKDLDLTWLALRLTIIEKAAANQKVPVILEDTFHALLDAPKLPLLGRMVKHLGSLTQVIHVSGAGHTASQVDAAVSI